ncbi:MAG: hypothetical protein AAGE52_35190 [Myxococcota bacterium]
MKEAVKVTARFFLNRRDADTIDEHRRDFSAAACEGLGLLAEAIRNELTPDLLRDLTRAIRKADADFESVGGSARHWVRECLWDALEAEGLRIVRLP